MQNYFICFRIMLKMFVLRGFNVQIYLYINLRVWKLTR